MSKWNINLPDADWYPLGDERLDGLVREVLDQDVVALDTETTGLNRWSDEPLYWSMAWGDSRRVCMPINTLPYFRRSFDDSGMRWVFANAKFDMHMVANIMERLPEGMPREPFAGEIVDTAVMHALLYEEESHKLKDMANSVLGWRWSDFFDTFKPQVVTDLTKEPVIKKGGKVKYATRHETNRELLSRFERDNLRVLVDYASNDAWGTLQLYKTLKKQLEGEKLNTLYPEWLGTMAHLFFLTEVPFTRVLWHCERNGVYVDKPYLMQLGDPMEQELLKLHRLMVTLSGDANFNPNSDDQVRRYFFDKEKLTPIKHTKGGKSGVKKASVDKTFLEHYEGDSAMASLMLQYAKLEKLLSTYIRNVDKHLDGRSRMHTKFNQDVARCMPAGELVLTSRGYLPVEQVAVGDSVIAHTGQVRTVTETSTHPASTVYAVTLENGLSLRTNGEHPYQTRDGWTDASKLTPGDAVACHSEVEIWRIVPDWPDFFVSTWGRVRNSKTGKILTQRPKGRWGHLKVQLYRNGAQARGKDRKDFSVHGLVARAWIGPAPYRMEVRHLDGIAWNNTYGNLTYGTPHENRQDALKHGTLSQRRAGRTKLTEADVQNIRRAGSPGQPPSSTSKLSYDIATEIRKRRDAHETLASLANAFGVSVAAVSSIVSNKVWTRPPSSAATAEALADKYSVAPGTIRDIWAGRRWQDEDYIEGVRSKFFWSCVKDVRVENEQAPTYGLTVAVDHSHVTGGIVTHNTGRLSCVAAWTPLKTLYGTIPIRSVRKGDLVWTHRERWQPILDVFTKGFEHMFDVRFSNGEVLTCTTAHLLLQHDGQWVSVGEVIDEYLQRMGGQCNESIEGTEPVQIEGASNDRGHRSTAGYNDAQRTARLEVLHASSRAQSTSQAAVLGLEDWQQESHDREDRRAASQLAGGMRGRLRLPDMPTQRQEAACASHSDGGSAESAGATGEPRRPSHRRQHEEQRSGQPSTGYQSRAQAHSFYAGKRLPLVTVEKVVYRGRLEVHDLTVAGDASYAACGVFSHNSSDPNLQNVPTPDKDRYKLRGAFRPQPGEGKTLIVGDYEQLEMRLTACATVTPAMPEGAKEMIQIFLDGKDIHMGSAELVFGNIYERRHGFRLTYDFLKQAKKIDGQVKEGKLNESARTEQVILAVFARNAIKTISFG